MSGIVFMSVGTVVVSNWISIMFGSNPVPSTPLAIIIIIIGMVLVTLGCKYSKVTKIN
jgi:hypothetical protein